MDRRKEMYKELDIREIKARGWLFRFLDTQANGMTGAMGKIGAPFSEPSWGETRNRGEKQGHFLGGMQTKKDSWVPYEQNGYWIDGAIRAGRLTDNKELIQLAGSKIYPELEMADEDGYIGPEFLKNGLTWQHAVYFRALIAEYTATKDERILNALKKHLKLSHNLHTHIPL